MSVIAIHRLTKRYGQRVGVDHIDLEVRRGDIFGFLGPNGAGKTTLIRVLLGFLRANDGHATIFGLDCWRRSHRIKRDVGYLPGDVRLYSWMTLDSAVSIVSKVRRRDLRAPARRLAERFDLDRDVDVRRMSRGMRQKLGLIIALAHEPKLVVLDEPTSGLDPLMQLRLGDYLRDRADAGCTVFLSSHTLREVEQLCSRVAIVRAGRLVADESLQQLRQRARRVVRLEFPDAAAASACSPPAFLSLRRREGAHWHGEMDGQAGPLVAWAAARGVVDLSIGPPDLESVFRRFYETEGRDA